jgi:site-specific recombinase XerD
VVNSKLQVVANPVVVGIPDEERREDHRRLLAAYIQSRWLRNLAEQSNERIRRGLDTFFASVGKYAWEVTEADVAAWHEDLMEAELAAATRRSYVGFVRTFYEYLKDHPFVPLSDAELRAGAVPAALQVKYGREVVQPVSPWVALVYATHEASNQRYLPTKEELRGFFAWLRQRVETSRKPLPLARDYAMYRLLYHTGLRANEMANLTTRDIRMESHMVHVRMGKGTKGSGPRTRWVPMMYGIETVLRIYVKEVRPKLSAGAEPCAELFLAEGGGPLRYSTIRNRLALLLDEAKTEGVDIQQFAPHDFRRAFATHFYEEYPTRVELLKEILGHTSISTTLRYTRPSRKYYEEQFAAVLGQRFDGFPREGDE